MLFEQTIYINNWEQEILSALIAWWVSITLWKEPEKGPEFESGVSKESFSVYNKDIFFIYIILKYMAWRKPTPWNSVLGYNFLERVASGTSRAP